MHIVKLIERRFPKNQASVIFRMVLLFVGLLLLGLGLMFIQ